MIHYIKRKNLDVDKYDTCIENSIQSRVYAFSWYLDCVAENWDVLVLDNYRAVMPIPWKKKYGIKYVYPPFWILELGMFSLDNQINNNDFFKELFKRFKFVETYLNTDNFKNDNRGNFNQRQVQLLPLGSSYQDIFSEYRKDRKKDLRKAEKANLVEKWNDDSEKLIQLFKENVGQRTQNIVAKDYANLELLIEKCKKNKVGEVLSIYNKEQQLVASGFFLKHKNCVTILISSTDFKNRKNGENTFLIDRAIFKYSEHFNEFNFGGSTIKSIANYFLSFGAMTRKYNSIHYNNLPFLLKLFKK